MLRPTARSIVTTLAMTLVLVPDAPASAQQAKCLAGKTNCMAKKATGLLKCEARAETPGKPADPNANECITKVKAKFDGGLDATKACFAKLEAKNPNDCLTFGDTAAAEAAVDACVATLVAAIDPPPLDQTKCGAGRKKCASKYLAGLLKCRRLAQTPGKPTDPNSRSCIDKAVAKFNGGADPAKGCFAKLEAKSPNDCQSTSPSLAVQGLVETCANGLVAVVAGSAGTTSTTTGATPTTTNTTIVTTSTTIPTACSGATDGTPCDDGSLCTINDHCAHGACVGDSKCGACTACLTTCNPATGQCSPGIAPNGTVCGPAPIDPECAQPSICLNGFCTENPLPDGTHCGVAPNQCAQLSTCQGGRCVSGALPDATPCDDGNPCTLIDRCQAGTCQGHQKNCDDRVALNFDTCNVATGACEHSPDPSRACPACGIPNRCCRQADGSGGFDLACFAPTFACEDTTGTVGSVCSQAAGQYVCPVGTICCGDDCCGQGDQCYQNKCWPGLGQICGNVACRPDEFCDPFTVTCVPSCGGTGSTLACLATEQCCRAIEKCCASNQVCGVTDCEAPVICAPNEVNLRNECCLNSAVCGDECCSPGTYCNPCTLQCVVP